MSLRNDNDGDFDYTPYANDYDDALKLDNNKEVTNEEIAALAHGDGFPMTEFQTKYFVVGDGLTTYRMKRQALVEIDTRRASLASMLKSQRKCIAEMALIKRDMEAEEDTLRRNLIECEYEDKLYDSTIYKHKIPQAQRELLEMINHLRSLFPGNPTIEDIKNIAQEDPEQERIYWQTRMAKQTAVDMIAQGRIGAGQMASIMLMDINDQEVVITKAIEYSTRLNNTIGKLDVDAQKKLLGRELNDIPLIEDNVEQITKNLVQSESIDD